MLSMHTGTHHPSVHQFLQFCTRLTPILRTFVPQARETTVAATTVISRWDSKLGERIDYSRRVYTAAMHRIIQDTGQQLEVNQRMMSCRARVWSKLVL